MADNNQLGGCGQGVLTRIGFGVLAVNAALAAFRFRGERDWASTLASVCSYTALLLLFLCLREFEADDEARRLHLPMMGRRRVRPRIKVWCLCTMLTAMSAWKVAKIMPWPLNVAVWAVAADAAVAGFFGFVLQRA